MKKLSMIGLAAILTLGMVSCGNSQDQSDKTAGQSDVTIAKNLNVNEFVELIKSRDNAIILDVRTPSEVAAGSIEGRIAIDYYAVDFNEQINNLDKDAPVFLYCAVGGRSGDAMRKMKKMGFKELYNLGGGIRAWQSQGKPVK